MLVGVAGGVGGLRQGLGGGLPSESFTRGRMIPEAREVIQTGNCFRVSRPMLIAAVVRSGATADTATIRALVPDAVAAEDRERFITLVREEFMSLHPGNAIRFGLRPLEYAAWRAANPDGEPY